MPAKNLHATKLIARHHVGVYFKSLEAARKKAQISTVLKFIQPQNISVKKYPAADERRISHVLWAFYDANGVVVLRCDVGDRRIHTHAAPSV